MIHEPEFIRGNQKNYIKIACNEEIFEGYEYQMCRHNVLKSILDFHERSQNGEHYIYYEISGMQSFDVFLQTQKLKRSFAEMFIKAIVRLCKELSEYALDTSCVVFAPKFVMVDSDGKDVKFIYSFHTEETGNEGIERLLECCIEYLDYKDEELTLQFYKIYERLLGQQEKFVLYKEMEEILSVFLEEEQQECHIEEIDVVRAVDPFCETGSEVSAPKIPGREESEIISVKSKIADNEFRNLKKSILLLFVIDLVSFFVWRPLNLLKIFFLVAVGGVLFALNIHIYRKEKLLKKVKEKQQKAEEYKEEYEQFRKNFCIDDDGRTQIINIKDSERFLYGVQNAEPQCIYFSDTKRIIGKDSSRVQICILQGSVSRAHALIFRDGNDYKVEDLNSTNGTWVNGEPLLPRNPRVLKEGDRVRFAEVEYIFR